MKLKKLLGLTLSAFLFFGTVSVHASEKTEDIILENDTLLTSDYAEESMNRFLGDNDKLIKYEEIYVRIDESSSTGVSSQDVNSFTEEKVKSFTKEEYINEMKNEMKNEIGTFALTPDFDVPTNDKYNWIKFRISVVKLANKFNNNEYSISASYEWKKHPFISLGGDVFAISHDSNITFDPTNVVQESRFYSIQNPFGKSYYQTNTSSSFVESFYGVGFKVPLNIPDNEQLPAPRGLIALYANKAGSSANVAVSYSHQQIPVALQPSFSIGAAGVSLNPDFCYDKADGSVQINF